jgi:hypothetical protein
MTLPMAFSRVFRYGIKSTGSLLNTSLLTLKEKKKKKGFQAWRDVDADKILEVGKPKSGALMIRLEIC